MITERVTITNRLGLHARAAARLVRLASQFQCVLQLKRVDEGAPVDAKSILSVLMLAASPGTELLAIAEGLDEREALNALCLLFKDGLGEERL